MAIVDLRTNLADWSTTKKKPSEANPAPVNFFDAGGVNTSAGATGFTKNFNNENASKFLGISSNNQSYTYPTTVQSNRLMQPRLSAAFPGPQNFFDDNTSGASGFRLNATDKFQSAFLGINGESYTYPDSVIGVQGNSINKVPYLSQTATFTNPIGTTNTFRYSDNKDRVATQGNADRTETIPTNPKRYEERVKSVKEQSSLSPLFAKSTKENSPSAITEQYTKFHITDEAYNPTYLAQPYIVRGIQRRGDPNPQRWGFNVNFDDGLVPAGIVAYTERIGADVARIAQFIASPKGLLWTAKQVGLQLSNPFTENDTRVFNPIQLVANVATAPLGIRVQRHGLVGVTARYEEIVTAKDAGAPPGSLYQVPLPNGGPYNRLLALSKEYFSMPSPIGTVGIPSVTLSSPFGGPKSVYGIGFTNISRAVDTRSNSVERAERYKVSLTDPLPGDQGDYAVFNYRFYNYKYAGQLRANTNIDSDANDSDSKRNQRAVDGGDFDTENENFSIRVNYDKSINEDVDFKSRTPGAGPPGQKPGFNIGDAVDISSDATRRTSYYADAPDVSIARYLTLTYSAIPKSLATENKTVPNDFRNALEFDDDRSKFIGKNKSDNYYQTNNLETKYGFGALGQVGEDRTTARGEDSFVQGPTTVANDTNRKRIITAEKFRGDKVTALDVITSTNTALTTDAIYPANANDLIEFYFEDGNQGVHVMPFRATITGLSDSFSPNWNEISILGYPQGASMYSAFSRSVSFSFIVAALSRSEMIPMWRKLNYLATYTMPDYKDGGSSSSTVRGTASGPFMRFTLGDLYRNAPGFIESLSYTIPDDTTWDIADDRTSYFKTPKQLPTVVEVSITYRIVAINDRLPEKMGRAYNLDNRDGSGDWLPDALRTEPAES